MLSAKKISLRHIVVAGGGICMAVACVVYTALKLDVR